MYPCISGICGLFIAHNGTLIRLVYNFMYHCTHANMIDMYRRKVYHHGMYIKMYPCISGPCLSLCILVYQASAVCLLHTMGHCLLPFPVSSPCPIYIMNTDIRSMDSPIVVMLRNEFFILIDISTNLLL